MALCPDGPRLGGRFIQLDCEPDREFGLPSRAHLDIEPGNISFTPTMFAYTSLISPQPSG